MANKLTICGDLSASGSIYGTLAGGVNSNCGTANTWSGVDAFNNVAAGAQYNTGYGYHAACSLTTGCCNTGFGALSLNGLTTGENIPPYPLLKSPTYTPPRSLILFL